MENLQEIPLQDYFLAIATVITILGGIREWRKGPSESEQMVTGSALNLIDRLNTRLEYVENELGDLRSEVENLDEENSILKKGINILIAQLRSLNIEPQWTPPKNNVQSNSVKKKPTVVRRRRHRRKGF